ncbi:MAG: hypothetical protein KGZ63_01750 [Clostridiales bacterium]|jgi:mono/diheme cytochrome c family protein|nr:hypothetical protein [Clostridiales bacterium]
MLKRLGFLLLLLLFVFIVSGCGSKPAQPVDPPGQEEPVLAEAELLINSRCSQCHGVNQVYRMKRKDAWPGIVDRMMSKSSGLLDDQEYELVVEFLQENYGN